MDLLPIGLAFTSGVMTGLAVLYRCLKGVVHTEGENSKGRAASRVVTGDLPSLEQAAPLANQLSSLEQQVTASASRLLLHTACEITSDRALSSS